MSNQTCKKCRIEKPVSEFHRKGAGHHKVCKVCRNAEVWEYDRAEAAGTLIRRKTPTIATENFTALQERIVSLDSKLHAKANAFAHDGMEADDIYSVMIEAILTKSKPTESDAYILQRANWTAQAYIAKNMKYSEYVDDLDVDDSEVEQSGFRIITNPRAIEDAMVQDDDWIALLDVIHSLPDENIRIVAMLSLGKNQRQIAGELKTSEQSISEKLKTLRASLKLQLA